MRVLFCESCGAPLDAPWAELVVVCSHCGAQNLPGKPLDPVPPRVPADGRVRLNLGGRTYVLEGHLARGDAAEVYRGRWVVRLGEQVVIKVLHALSDADLLRREWQTLSTLAAATTSGADHFVTRLPAPVAFGSVTTDTPRLAAVYGWRPGFVHTLEAVGQSHPSGVPGEVVVWILKRLLELLGWVHQSGFVHGAVHPGHVLIHPRDHGAMLVGWTAATPWVPGRPQPLPAISRPWARLYPADAAPGAPATPTMDVVMACRCALAAGGWDPLGPELPVGAPGPLAEVLKRGVSGREADAWALRDALVEASRAAFGPPAYHPLTMPGWT